MGGNSPLYLHVCSKKEGEKMTIPNPPSKKTMKQLTTLFWIIVALFVIFIFRDMIWAILSVLWGFWQNISTIGR